MVLPGGMLTIGLRDERRSRSRDLEKTPGSTAEAERLEGDPQYLIRVMPAKGNRLAGLLRAHRLGRAANR
jgi:hypothetical protein